MGHEYLYSIFVLCNKICQSGLSLLDNRTDGKLQINIIWWSMTLFRVPVLYVFTWPYAIDLESMILQIIISLRTLRIISLRTVNCGTMRKGPTISTSKVVIEARLHSYTQSNELSQFLKSRTLWLPNSFFHDLIKDLARDVTSSSVLCLRMALTDIPILVDCGDTFHQNPSSTESCLPQDETRRYLKQLQRHGDTT